MKAINKNSESNPLKQTTGRRSMITRAATMVGACFLTSAYKPAVSQVKNTVNIESVFDVKNYGATGRREDNATKAFRNAIQACTLRGGGIVNVPPGEYTVGTIELKDNITLNIEAGAILFLSQSKDDFKAGARSMIFAENAKNIAITGRGTLDGLAQYDYAEMRGADPEITAEIELAKAAGVDMRRYYRKSSAMNTFMFVINDCTDVKLTGVTVMHSPLWNVRLNDCNRVYINGVYIYSDLEKGVNADGIDICSSSNVTISDSVIVCGDDSIVLKTISRGGKKANPCENITVTNCILSSSSTPLMIGTETEADIKHVLFNNCVIRNSNKGFGINVQDGATVSNIIFSNLTIETNRRHWNWWGSAEMCKFILKKRTSTSRLGIIKDVKISNIIAAPRGTSTITGHPEQPLENISISDVQIQMNAEDAKDKRATHAFKIEGVKALKIHDLSVDWSENEAEDKWKSALVLKDITGAVINSFKGRQGLKSGNEPAILLDNVRDMVIINSQAAEGTATFIHLQGKNNNDILLKNNMTNKAEKLITFESEQLKNVVEVSL